MSELFKVFIDGEVGTTGLQIRDRLKHHDNIELLSIAYDDRKNNVVKKAIMAESDVVVLCLPDDAAKESVQLAKGLDCRILDASTAHRVNEDWVYGLAEAAPNQRSAIRNAKYVSNPGCYSTGAILLLKPLVENGLDIPYTINAVSGYSGGGNQMIDAYQADGACDKDTAYSLYGLNFEHKHIPEIEKVAALSYRPMFFPSVVDVEQGMMVKVAIDFKHLESDLTIEDFVNKSLTESIHAVFSNYYQNEPNVYVHNVNYIDDATSPFIRPCSNNGTNRVDLYVYCHELYKQVLLVVKFDNLGKGASGAAVQNLNIMLGLDEDKSVGLI